MSVKKEDHRVQAGATGATGPTGYESNWGDTGATGRIWAGGTGTMGAIGAAHDKRSRDRLLADFCAEMKEYFERRHNSLVALKAKFQAINDQVSALQNSPDVITPGDQKLLDGIVVGVAAFSDDLDTFAAVHPLTPPSIP